MSYRQTTHCIAKSDFDAFWNFGGRIQDAVISPVVSGALQAAKTAFIGALMGAGIAAVASGGTGTGFGALIGGMFGLSLGFVNGFCDQWLNKRLICLTPQDQCIVGKVAHIEWVANKPYYEQILDNDVAINVRMVPYDGAEFKWGDTKKDYDWVQMQKDGFPAAALVKQQFADLSYEGYTEEKDPHGNHPGARWSLHCEFEGDAMETLCGIARVLAVVASIPPVFVVLVFVGAVVGAGYGAVNAIKQSGETFKKCRKWCKIPIVCHAICALWTVATWVGGFVLGAVAGALAGPGGTAVLVSAVAARAFGVVHDGQFSDAADDPDSGTLHEEDCVFVAGDHVYDAGHPEGWHELHPVKHVQKTCQETLDPQCCPHADSTSQDAATGVRTFDDPAFRDRVLALHWCGEYLNSKDPLTIQNQDHPENLWCLHPLIDGCQRRTDPASGGTPPLR